MYKEGNYVFPPALGEDTIDFLRFILQVDPQKRPTAKEVLQHGWFQSKLARGRKRKLVTESQQSSRVQFPLNIVKPVAEGQVVRDMISANPPQKIIDHIHSAALVDVMKRPPRIDPLDIDSFLGQPGAALRGSVSPTFARPEMMQRAPPRVMSLADHLLNAVRNRQLERRRRHLEE